MVIVHLTGGLGNQLSQYAAARRIVHLDGGPLKLDISTFETDVRSYRLSNFNIIQDFASDAEVRRLTGMPYKGLVGRIIRRIRKHLPFHNRSVLRERGHRFDPEVLSRTGSTYLDERELLQRPKHRHGRYHSCFLEKNLK